MSNLLRLSACLFVLLSFNVKASMYVINEVQINQIWSTTFDGMSGNVPIDDGSYFGVIPNIENPLPGANRVLSYNPYAGESGSGFLAFDGEELLGVSIFFPDGQAIAHSPSFNSVVDVSNMSLVIGGPHYDNGSDDNFDVAKSHNTGYIIGNWSPFMDIIQNCVGIFCPVMPFLDLNLYGFTLEGVPTQNGGDQFVLRGQTINYSYIEIEFTTVQTTPVPLPAGIYLFLSGLVGLGLMRGRNG